MKQSFLRKLALEILDRSGSDLNHCSVILPNRRARIFLIEHFKELLEEGSWLPRIVSMEDFIAELSELNPLDQMDLLFEFYELYLSIEKDEADDLEEFMGWGNMLLYDFNEIDRNLIDAKELFGFLNESKALKVWNLKGEDLTDFQKKYLKFWKQFGIYYQELKEKLIEKSCAYQGLMYREALEGIRKGLITHLRDEKYIFAGFNALTPAEEELIKEISKVKKVDRIWDADQYYLDDQQQEAGTFLRKHKQQNKEEQFNFVSSDLLSASKEINIYSAIGNIGQVELNAELLSKRKEAVSLKETAIVLAEENLLLPLLESLPEELSPLNVTMGYPVNQSSFYQYFEAFLKLHSNQQSTQAKWFYYRDLYAFLEHPLNKTLHSEKIENSVQLLKKSNKLYFDLNFLGKQLPDELFNHFKIEEDIISTLKQIGTALMNSAKLSDIEKEMLFHFQKSFNRLKEISQRFRLKHQSILKVYQQFLSRANLSFVGEPLDGLQIMGVLESRTLDFKEVYVLSMNEGILPSGKAQNSLIPFDIKKHFGMPTYKEKDAIFAYHFYRLIQRAEKVHLIYNSKVDGLKGGERSRFIEQLIIETREKNPKITINEYFVANDSEDPRLAKEVIKKNPRLLSLVDQRLKEGLSPSSINTFLQCPLDFYYKYLIKLKEENQSDPEDEIEDSLFGELLHNCLEYLYRDHLNIILNRSIIGSIRKRLRQELIRVFEEKNIDLEKGKGKLVFEVCQTYLNRFLDFEESRVEDQEIIVLEVEQQVEIEINSAQLTGGSIKLKGTIDRIEKQNGVTTIIDYKSGKVEGKDLKAKSMNEILDDEKNKYGKQLQLLVYQLLYQKKSNEKDIRAGIYSFKNSAEGVQLIPKSDLEEIENAILSIVKDLQNPESTLIHNENAEFCSFCRDVVKRKAFD